MTFKNQLDAEYALVKELEGNIKLHYLQDSESNDDPEKRLIAAIFHQALLDAFHQIRPVRKKARDWLLSTEYAEHSAEWYAEIADYEEPLKRIRAFLFNPDYKKIVKELK